MLRFVAAFLIPVHTLVKGTKMAIRWQSAFLVLVLCVFGLSLYSCIREVKGIPVREHVEREMGEAPSTEQRKAQQEEIARLSRVTENSVFTEKRGFPEYKIGPGDTLKITRWDRDNPVTYEAKVRPDGEISYSYLHDLQVGGKTAQDVDELMTEALSSYIKDPRIDVEVREFKSKSAIVFGQINRSTQGFGRGPGEYNLVGKQGILDFIVKAGGPIMGEQFGNADLRHVEVDRGGKSYTINLYDFMFRGDHSQNIIVDHGDIIIVPELPDLGERVFVFGEVNSQGIYRLKDAVDVLGALSKAGGTTQVAVDSDVKIIRGYRENRENPIVLAANLDHILKKGDISQNIKLIDGDVVYVPRTTIGDINEFIVNTVPLLDYLLYPRTHADAYSADPQALRF